MLKDIQSSHPIFQSNSYLMDQIPFSVLEMIRQNPALLVSNERNLVIAMSDPNYPLWIWTAYDIAQSDLDELVEWFYTNFQAERNSIRFVAKPNVAESLAKPFLNGKGATPSVIQMESFQCLKIIQPKSLSTKIERPMEQDVPELASCFSKFKEECFGETLPSSTYLIEAQKMLENPLLFVIKEEEKVVATANASRETNNYISVSRVYTKPNYRGKGFAKSLVYEIARQILVSGKIPILYTDLANPFSNKAYTNIGFTPCGKLDDYRLTWE